MTEYEKRLWATSVFGWVPPVSSHGNRMGLLLFRTGEND